MLQGEKQMLVGERALRYGAGCYVQVGTTIPVSGQVVRASEAESYYGIRVDLDPKEIASFLLEMQVPMPLPRDDLPIVSVEIAGAALLAAFERLLRLVNRPVDLPVLGRLLKQESMYPAPRRCRTRSSCAERRRRRDLSLQNNILAEHLRDRAGLCYSSPPLRQRPKNVNVIKWLR